MCRPTVSRRRQRPRCLSYLCNAFVLGKVVAVVLVVIQLVYYDGFSSLSLPHPTLLDTTSSSTVSLTVPTTDRESNSALGKESLVRTARSESTRTSGSEPSESESTARSFEKSRTNAGTRPLSPLLRNRFNERTKQSMEIVSSTEFVTGSIDSKHWPSYLTVHTRSDPKLFYEQNRRNTTSCIATAYFRLKSKHSNDAYLAWMNNFLSMRDCMVIFCTQDMVETMLQYRNITRDITAIVVVRSLEDLPIAQYYHPTGAFVNGEQNSENPPRVFAKMNKTTDARWNFDSANEFWRYQFEIDGEKDIHQSYPLFWIWLGKSWFAMVAALDQRHLFGLETDATSSAALPPLIENWMWCDIGVMRDTIYRDQYLIHPDIASIFFDDPTAILLHAHSQISPPPLDVDKYWDAKLKQGWHFYQVGGLALSSSIEAWVTHHANFIETMDAYAERDRFIGDDQPVLQATCLLHPQNCLYSRFDMAPDDPYFGLRYIMHHGTADRMGRPLADGVQPYRLYRPPYFNETVRDPETRCRDDSRDRDPSKRSLCPTIRTRYNERTKQAMEIVSQTDRITGSIDPKTWPPYLKIHTQSDPQLFLEQAPSSCIVTVYFKVKSKHSSDAYVAWMKNFLSMRDCMVIFCLEDMVDTILQHRNVSRDITSLVVLRSLEDLPIAQYYHPTGAFVNGEQNFENPPRVFSKLGVANGTKTRFDNAAQFWQYQLDIDGEKDHHQSYQVFWIWLAKSWFASLTALDQRHLFGLVKSEGVTAASTLPPLIENWMWCDIGAFRDDSYNHQFLIHPNISSLFVDNPTIILWHAHAIPNPPLQDQYWDKKLTQGWHFYQVGGLSLSSNIEAWCTHHANFMETLDGYTWHDRFIGDDQPVIQSTCIANPATCAYSRFDMAPDDPYFGMRYMLHHGTSDRLGQPLANGMQPYHWYRPPHFKETFP